MPCVTLCGRGRSREDTHLPRLDLAVAMGVGTAGAMVDVSTYAKLEDGLTRSWGRTSEFDNIPPGEFSFVLDNIDGRFTPGNTASPLVTTVTEGMEVCVQVGSRLTAGTIRSIEPSFPGAVAAWATLTVVCDDMLGDAGRLTLSNLVDSIEDGATPFLLWPLSDDPGTTTPDETAAPSVVNPLLRLTGSTSAFGASAIDAIGETQLTLLTSLSQSGVWPVFDFDYTADTLGAYSFWFTNTGSSEVVAAISLTGLARTIQFGYVSGEFFVRDGDSGTPATYALVDTEPHLVAVALSSVYTSAWTITATLYVDGTSRGSIDYGDTVASLDYRAPTALALTAT